MKKAWSQITIDEYQELVNIQNDSELLRKAEAISILTGMDPSEVKKAPIKDFIQWCVDVEFIFKTSPDANFNKTFVIDGIRYGFITDLDNLTTGGEWIDSESWKDKPIDNMHNYAAMLFRPVVKYVSDTDYTIEEHKVEGFIQRAQLFKDRLSVDRIYGAQIFFLTFALEYSAILADSLKETESGQKKKSMKKKAHQQTMKVKGKKRSTGTTPTTT